MKKNKHVGSAFDDFLDELGIKEEVDLAAMTTVERFHKSLTPKERIHHEKGYLKLLKSELKIAIRKNEDQEAIEELNKMIERQTKFIEDLVKSKLEA
jgi:hypothetical protein